MRIKELKKIYKIFIIEFISILFLVFASLSASAQNVDFSGTWILSKQISLSGDNYLNGVPKKIIITQSLDSIIIVKISVGENKDDSVIQALMFNGEPRVTITELKNNRSSVLKWSGDEKSFIETSNITAPVHDQLKSTSEFNWSLSENKTNIILIRNYLDHLSGETYSMKGVYDKK